MEEFSQKLTKKIMRRVYGIWFLRQVGPVLTGMPLSLGLALWLAAREFFVAKIVENFTVSANSGSIPVVLNFIGSALYNAPFLPIAIVGFSSGLFMVLAYRLIRNLKQFSLVRV